MTRTWVKKNLDPTTQEKVLTLHSSKLDANRRFVCYIEYSKIPFVLLCLIDCNICRNKQSMMKVTLNFFLGERIKKLVLFHDWLAEPEVFYDWLVLMVPDVTFGIGYSLFICLVSILI